MPGVLDFLQAVGTTGCRQMSSKFYKCSSIHVYNPVAYDTKPLYSFRSQDFRISSFYVNLSLAPNGSFLACGSSTGTTFLWEVDQPTRPPIQLDGLRENVSTVSWNITGDQVFFSQFTYSNYVLAGNHR